MLRVTCDDGSQGTGYSYTIGTALQSRPMHRDWALRGMGRRLKIRRFDAHRWEISASAFRRQLVFTGAISRFQRLSINAILALQHRLNRHFSEKLSATKSL